MTNKKKKIVVIQSRVGEEAAAAEQNAYRILMTDAAALDCVSTLDSALPWTTPEKILNGYDGMIIAGAADYYFDGAVPEDHPSRTETRVILDRVSPLIAYAEEKSIPTLGVCFGHQLIAEVHGGRVKHDFVQKKTGSFKVHLTSVGKKDPIFGTLPDAFTVQYAHKDSVTERPRGAQVLVDGPTCHFSVLRYGEAMYGVQFHPEHTAESLVSSLRRSMSYVPGGVTPESLVQESPEASRIVPLFVERVVRAG